MSSCDKVRPQLSGYVDRHLDAARAGEVRAHLLSCDACRGIADDLGLLRDAARKLGPIDPPPHVWLEIAGRVRLESGAPSPEAATPIRTASAPGRSRADTWQWLGLAAALLLTTLAVYSIATPDTVAPVVATTDTIGNPVEVPTVET